MQWSVDGSVSDVKEERLVWRGSFACTNHGDRFIGDVIGEVIALGVGIGLHRSVVTNQSVGLMKIRESVEESVELVEAALAGPRMTWTRIGLIGVFREVPFANHVGGVTIRPQSFRKGDDIFREFHGVAREPWIRVRHGADACGMWIHSSEKSCASGRTHWR